MFDLCDVIFVFLALVPYIAFVVIATKIRVECLSVRVSSCQFAPSPCQFAPSPCQFANSMAANTLSQQLVSACVNIASNMVAHTIVVPYDTGPKPVSYTFTVDAKVDITGQCSPMDAHVECGESVPKLLFLDLQKRHKRARINLLVSSDHADPCPITVFVKTPGRAQCTYHITIGMHGGLFWNFCSFIASKTNVSRDTVWEIWTPMGEQGHDRHVISIQFRKCKNNKRELIAESFGLSDGDSCSESEMEPHGVTSESESYSPLKKHRKK